jgi:hypothetical protein
MIYRGTGFLAVISEDHKEMSWLTNSALVYKPKSRRGGGGGIAGSRPMTTAVHMEAI